MNLTEVILEEGKVLHTCVETDVTAFDLSDGHVPVKSRTPLDLVITNKGNKVLQLQGRMSMEVLIPCAKCLEPVPTTISLDFDRECDMKLTEQERSDALDESDFLHGYNLDVDKLVYGEALLVWPMKVLCQADCKGLCPVCGQNLNLKTCDCDRTDLDPRMAKIRDIFQNFKEV